LARILIIGCGCRGRALAGSLIERGHAVRGTTRREDQLQTIEQTGAEAVLADPDRVATLAPALANVGVVAFLLGSAHGTSEQLEALHGPRLQMLLTRVLDSPARAFLYESGSGAVLTHGAQLVAEFCERSRIPYRLLAGADPETWAKAVDAVLA
jgi:nucleoside-diphosphate-sugar epimerase